MSLPSKMPKLRLAYQLPNIERVRRIAVAKPRANDIFISYSSQSTDFVRLLDQAIRAEGLDPWIDFDDIPDFNSFIDGDSIYEKYTRSGILRADVFVLILPTAPTACEITLARLRLAQRLNKLIVVLDQDRSLHQLGSILAILPSLQYLDLRAQRVAKIFEQVARNIIHLQTYTRLLARATEWDKQGRPAQYLLTPEDLKEVKKQKHWIETHRLGEQFRFTDVQKTFLETVNKVHETSEYFGKSPPDIFITYARKNSSFVGSLSGALRENRWKIWLDHDRIPVAANWRNEAEEGIRYAHTIIFVVCPDSLVSKNCRWELEQARKYKKRIIPVISHANYDRELFKTLGFSSIHYVSFIREGETFQKSISQLLDALKVHLEDLKIYRQLLVKSYEWSESERIDRLLMSRFEYKDVNQWYEKRRYLYQKDNRELEPLLPLQREYMQSSQRYLALQRKRQSFAGLSVLSAFCGLSFLLLNTTFSEIRALVRSLDDLNGLDALMTGLQAGQRVQHNSLLVNLLRPGLRAKATTALHRTALKLREVHRFEGHRGKVFSVVFSPDGQQLVSVGIDKTIRFMDLQQQRSFQEIERPFPCESQQQEQIGFHTSSVRTIDYSSDQNYIATGDADGAVKLWTCSGQLHKTLSTRHQVRGPEGETQTTRVNRVAFSPGSQYLASAGADGQIFLWTRSDDFTTLRQLKHPNQAEISSVTFSPDGQYLASADVQGRVYLWEIDGHGTLPTVTLDQVFQYDVDPKLRLVTTVMFSPDSSLLAFAGLGAAIQVQNLRRQTQRQLVDHDGFIYSLVFSSDGRTLASASADATVKLWNLGKTVGEELVHTLRGHQGPVYRVQFGPQDDVLATGGADGVVRLWLREKGTQIDALEGHEDEISSLAFAPKPAMGYSTLLASSSDDGSVRLWNLDSPIQPLPHNSDVYDVAYRNDGRVIASGGVHTVRLWRQDGTSKSEIQFDASSRVWTVDYSPDGKLLAAGGSNGAIKLWQPDINTNKPIYSILEAHPVLSDIGIDRQGVLDLSFSHDGQWLVSVGSDRTLKVWKVEEQLIHRHMTLEHDNDVLAVALSQDDRLLVTGTRAGSAAIKRGLHLWEMPQQGSSNNKVSLRTETEAKHTGSVLSVAIQPNGRGWIASGGEDGTINLWTSSGKWVKTLDEHTDAVTQVSFSANGLFLASSSKDGTVRLWTAKGELISVLDRHKRAVSSVEFGPEGDNQLASSSANEDVLLWNLWDLSDTELAVENSDREILDMLVANGCETVLPFLESNTQSSGRQSNAWQSITDEEYLKDMKKLKAFCNGPSILPAR